MQCKQGSSWMMLKQNAPKKVWNHSIELQAQIRSHTVLDIYELEGQVPETVMSGQMADISAICEFVFFQWVMFYQPTEQYPNAKLPLGGTWDLPWTWGRPWHTRSCCLQDITCAETL